ncbi:cytochrome c-type biogenesis protein [Nitrincola sp.]|uniref:cytochrome c-type biogenesis protein n=1 Tax=Nitrincola sp. TaxID=1926584 RepID=UPI003A8D5BFD
MSLRLSLFALLLLLCSGAQASFETYEFSTTQNEMRYFHLSKELRCPTCQNQNISDSDAPLAADLRRELHRMIEAGYDDDEILDFMVSRFGDFVHYRPRISPDTYLLWFGPFALLLGGFGAVWLVARNRRLRRTAIDSPVQPEANTQFSDELTSEQRSRLNKLLQQDKNL